METDTWQPCKCLCGTAARYNIKCIHQLTGKGCYKNVFSLRLLPPPKIGIMQTRATVQLETRGITKKQGTLEKEGAWRQAPDLEGAEVGPWGTQLPLSHTIPFHGHFIPWHLWMSLNLSLFTYDQGSNVVTALVMESSFSRKKEKKKWEKKKLGPWQEGRGGGDAPSSEHSPDLGAQLGGPDLSSAHRQHGCFTTTHGDKKMSLGILLSNS